MIGPGRSSPRVTFVAIAVAVAFADSSIVVLALPDLYGRFDATIAGIAWVITSYNLALALGGLALVRAGDRIRADAALAAGSLVFLVASIACALAGSLPVLVAARAVQGLGGALLLAGALLALGDAAGSTPRGLAIWTVTGTFGVALGPALGGALTQLFDWRAIFVMQAPVAAGALSAAIGVRRGSLGGSSAGEAGERSALLRVLPANLCLALVFGALVGALFLGVLLVVDVFRSPPIEGAAVVTAIPIAALLAQPLALRLPGALDVVAGALLLAAGLLALALLPSSALGYAVGAFALSGLGLGLCVPGLTAAALTDGAATGRLGALTVGIRHLGLVVALVAVAPLLAGDLSEAADVASLNGAAVVIDGRIPATTKIPLALDIRDAIDRAPKGEVPDFTDVFEEHGAGADAAVRVVRDELTDAIELAMVRGFRGSFVVCSALAALAAVAATAFRRWIVR
ncbi:MAG TPA: MFS transporter [Actinomycetota bacterium]